MWRLIKTEIKYSGAGYIMVFILPVLFTIYLLLGHPRMNEENIITRVFWPTIIGFLPVLLILKFWYLSYIKENHERKNCLLAVTKFENALTRTITLVLPAFTLLVYIFVVHIILIESWPGIISRIITTIGINFLLGSTLLLTYDINHTFANRFSGTFFLTGFVVFTAVIIVMGLVDKLWFDQLAITFAPGMGLIIFGSSLIILMLDVFVYQHRISHLN